MTYKITLVILLILATILGVISFFELSEYSGLLHIGTWTLSVLMVSECVRRIVCRDY
jgi:hypothetical protein